MDMQFLGRSDFGKAGNRRQEAIDYNNERFVEVESHWSCRSGFLLCNYHRYNHKIDDT
jgi:hypothetical protein